MEYILFKPLYQERVWGGRAFAYHLGRKLPENRPIGESWEIVDRQEATSEVSGGNFAGKSLRTVIEDNTETIMGSDWPPQRRFPILVKWLDCRERLSLQVHPPAGIAPELGGEPKTENWYIAGTTGDAAVLAGLKRGVTRNAFEEALRAEKLESLVWRLPCRPGDSLFVPSGRIHAIDAGNLILEIQQNSDTTYRVYDWGRKGLDGKPRTLHVEESLKSIDFDDFEPELTRADGDRQVLAQSDEFTLHRISLEKGESLDFVGGRQPRILSIVRGALKERRLKRVLETGDNVLLPYGGDFSFQAEEPSTVLVTEDFA